MEGKRLIEKIRLRNILSFGDKGEEIELQPLNVIIGQNASGKSNLIDVIKLLHYLPVNTKYKSLANFIYDNGGIYEWIWKGNQRSDNMAEINVELHLIPIWKEARPETILYKIRFTELEQKLVVPIEEIANLDKKLLWSKYNVPTYDSILSYSAKESFYNLSETDKLRLSSLGNTLSLISLHTDLQTNRASELRKPKLYRPSTSSLEDDAENLVNVLHYLKSEKTPKQKVVENLQKFYPRIEDYEIEFVRAGEVQLFIREEGLEKPISAMRLSDGTLRYLCLLAILCHPEPPPLICIEEPETGLHPDILPTIAELMIEASQRTQLIVTTHSDIFVSAFSEIPEAVLVCEKDEDGTHFKRLEKDKLKAWLEEYELGDLWLKGEIGGKRW